MYIESVELVVHEQKERLYFVQAYGNPFVESIEKLLGNSLPRKFLDDFSYRENQESLVPSIASVSKKKQRVWETSIIWIPEKTIIFYQ